MIRLGPSRGARAIVLREDSPLRRVDPRVKLALSLGASLAVMLPLERLAAFMVLYAGFLVWARLIDEALVVARPRANHQGVAVMVAVEPVGLPNRSRQRRKFA